jgi:exodeoxyribonuclease V gamma subunit
LQPFDGRNFETGRLRPASPWGFDATALGGAVALSAPPQPAPSFAATLLPPTGRQAIELDDLVRFAEHPVKAFLRQRLGIAIGADDDELATAIQIEIDGLGRWAVGDRLLAARLDGVDLPDAVGAETARGLLPPRALGYAVVDEVAAVAAAIHAAVVAEIGSAERTAIDVDAVVGAERIVGTVPDVYGDVLLNATYSRVAAKHRIAAWVRLLALTVSGAGAIRAVTIGRGRPVVGVARIPAVAADAASASLATIVDLYRRGMREPLPLYCSTSEALARRRNARAEWETGPKGFPREDRDPAHVFVLGEDVPFSALRRESPRPDETGAGWSIDEPTRLGQLAHRLWGDLLAIERRDGL